MEADHRAHLAQILEARLVQLGLTWEDVAAKGSITAETLRQVRKYRREISKKTKRGIELGLDWHTGSVDNILAGGEPQPLPRTPVELPGLPSGDILAQLDWVRRQPWSVSDQKRIADWLIGLSQQQEEERRAAG